MPLIAAAMALEEEGAVVVGSATTVVGAVTKLFAPGIGTFGSISSIATSDDVGGLAEPGIGTVGATLATRIGNEQFL